MMRCILMSTFLVTGGSGYIGTRLSDKLAQQGHSVVSLDHSMPTASQSSDSRIRRVYGDVCDRMLIEDLFHNIDGCFHLAHSTNDRNDQVDGPNLRGTMNVFGAAQSSKRISIPVIYASSACVYGDNATIPLTESAELRPVSNLGIDKAASEMFARIASLKTGVPSIGLRLFNVYGPGKEQECNNLDPIAHILKCIESGNSIEVNGDGEQQHDYIYIEDVIEIFLKAMEKAIPRHQIFNVCTGRKTSLNALIQIISSMFNINVPMQYLPRLPGDIDISLGDPKKTMNYFKLDTFTSLEQGLLATFQHHIGTDLTEKEVG